MSGGVAGSGIAHRRQDSAVCGAQRQHFEARRRDEHRVLPLRRQRVILRDDGPAVRQQLHVALARVDHRLDGDGHAGHSSSRVPGLP